MTKEQYDNDAAAIEKCHTFLKEALKDSEEGLQKLSTLYETAGINLKEAYLGQTNLQKLYQAVLNIMIYPYILEGIKKGSIDPKINCKVYLKINAFFEQMESELQLKINAEK